MAASPVSQDSHHPLPLGSSSTSPTLRSYQVSPTRNPLDHHHHHSLQNGMKEAPPAQERTEQIPSPSAGFRSPPNTQRSPTLLQVPGADMKDHPKEIRVENAEPDGDLEQGDEERSQTTPLQAGVESNQERRSLRRSISLRRDEARWEKQQRVLEELTETVEVLQRSLELAKAEKYKLQNTLEVELEQHKERSRVLQEELDKQLEKGALLRRSLEGQQAKSAKLQAKLEASKEMLTKFQGCYKESLQKNETLSQMITPKCFDSMADYEFFVVSAHSEQLNTEIVHENEALLNDIETTLTACKSDTFFTNDEIKNDLVATPTPLLSRKLSQYAKPELVVENNRKSPGPVSPGKGTLKMTGGKIELKKPLEKEPSQGKLRKSSMEPIHENEVSKSPEGGWPRASSSESITTLSRESSTSSGNLRRNVSSTSLKTKSKYPLRSAQTFKPEIYFPAASKYDFLLPSLIKNQPPKLS